MSDLRTAVTNGQTGNLRHEAPTGCVFISKSRVPPNMVLTQAQFRFIMKAFAATSFGYCMNEYDYNLNGLHAR